MGGCDIYCAICGSTFSSTQFISIDSDDEGDNTYDGEVIGDSDIKWLDNLRALGINSNVTGERKSFLTGDGIHNDTDIILAYPGEDPNVPYERGLKELCYFYAYMDISGDQEEEPVIPFHKLCFEEIFLRCFKDESLNGDILHALCMELVNRVPNMLLLYYGEPTPPCEQFWECKKGEELLVTNPVDIPQLKGYLDELRPTTDQTGSSPAADVQETSDIFSRLPRELRHHLFGLLPIASVLALKAASWSMHSTDVPETSWKKRLQTELGWLWELHDVDLFKSQKLEARLSAVVAELEAKSRYNREKVDYIPGLANRRRIWMVCEDIKDLYRDKVAESEGRVLDSSSALAVCRVNISGGGIEE
ncbi:hypothetical protein BDV59DRAFT_198561 [Aspergillus ambiguus]|uniref:uncharacterized protein n=1 Tax=Aspergillus ambiguus TaxID=176160 RepID=UPI003CCDE2C4